jgi:2-methylcitrate dehydratase PrpD
MDLRTTAKKQQRTVPPSQALSKFLAALRYEDLPENVVARTKALFLDWFASVLAGRAARPVQVLEKFTAQMGPASGPSEVLTSRMRTSPLFAALVNGAASHVVEQDDIHKGGGAASRCSCFSRSAGCSAGDRRFR